MSCKELPGVTDVLASSCCRAFLNTAVKEQECVDNQHVSHWKPLCSRRSCINDSGRTLHCIYQIVFAQLIEFGVYELKRSCVNYNPQFAGELGREIHFHLLLFSSL